MTATATVQPSGLTRGAHDILLILVEWHKERGVFPTLAEIDGEIGVGRSGVFRYLTQLEERGWIKRVKGRARAITLLHPVELPDWSETFVLSDTVAGPELLAQLPPAFPPTGCNHA